MTNTIINNNSYTITTDAGETFFANENGKTHASTLKAAARALGVEIKSLEPNYGTFSTYDTEHAAMMVEALNTRG